MVWESEDGYALDDKNHTWTDPETGEELLYGDLLRKIEQQNWREMRNHFWNRVVQLLYL